MKLVIQRVTRASVRIEEQVHSAIGRGLLVLLGIEQGATWQRLDRHGEPGWHGAGELFGSEALEASPLARFEGCLQAVGLIRD